MVIYDNERERRVLERRLELLDILDDIIRRDIALGVSTDIESAEVKHITKQFREVLNPCDMCDRIREIYKPEHFGPGPTNRN
jgi:hypothetical protein